MGLTAPGAKTPSLQQSANLAHQLHLIKDLLSAPLTALVGDSSEIKNIFEQIESQLSEPLQIKLWAASNLPFFRVEVNKAQQRIEARRSQASLKTDIAQKCKALNQKKATLNIKALWTYLKLEQGAFMKLSADSELVFVMLPVLKKKHWAVQERSSC